MATAWAGAGVGPVRANRAIDEAIRAIPAEWFRPSPAIYWMDLLASAAVGWTVFVLAVRATSWHRVALLLIVIFALYRAALFIHEITHRARRDVPTFTLVWNALVGVPLLIPSFLYEGVHTDHHRQRSYGTEADPEYMPFGRRPPTLIVGSALVSLVAPVAFAVRFGILAPLSWGIPALRRPILERYSALVINHRYVRRAPIDAAGLVQETAAFAVVWASVGLWWTGLLPAAVFYCWFVASGSASGINAFRTLAAHRYDRDSGELSMTDQLLDSCTIVPAGGPLARVADAGRALTAPLGLRYHALHHWIPSLPYHNLGRAHRLLVATLRSDAPYHATLERGLAPAVGDLLRRSRTQSRA
jgi:fatty acid desaturase